MRASGPTARAALSIEQLFHHPLDMLRTGLRFLHDRRPANPLVTRERRKVVPSFERVGVGVQRGSHIGGNHMDDAGSNGLFLHGGKTSYRIDDTAIIDKNEGGTRFNDGRCYTASMTLFLKLYAIALPVFFAIDMAWLGLVAKNFYREQIGHLLKPDVNWTAAIAFYLLFLAGLVAFVIAPAVESKQWTHALAMGAFFGLVSYATYDLTNLAVAKDWPLTLTLVDMAWGTALGAAVSTATYFVAQKIG